MLRRMHTRNPVINPERLSENLIHKWHTYQKKGVTQLEYNGNGDIRVKVNGIVAYMGRDAETAAKKFNDN